jgi:hypothetical protein
VRVGANGDVGIVAAGQKSEGGRDIGGALVAECFCEIRRAYEGARAEALANAILFAASHELLAALHAVGRDLSELLSSEYATRRNPSPVDTHPSLIAARAAIAKATGSTS